MKNSLFVVKIIVALVCLFTTNICNAILLAGPQIVSMSIDRHNVDVIYLCLSGVSCKFVVSSDGGDSFKAIDIKELPTPENITSTLSTGSRRYVIANNTILLRSDDGGANWRNTAISSFIRTELRRDSMNEVALLANKLPVRSPCWHKVFIVLVLIYFFVTLFMMRHHGKVMAAWTSIRGVVGLFGVWLMLCGCYFFIPKLVYSSYKDFSSVPNYKVYIVMNITTSPVFLIVYLLSLWAFMPGFYSIMRCHEFPRLPVWRRVIIFFFLTLSVIFMLGHLFVVFPPHFVRG